MEFMLGVCQNKPFMLSVIMLNGIMLNVVATFKHFRIINVFSLNSGRIRTLDLRIMS